MPAPREPRDLAAAADQCERMARHVRVLEGARRGIRAVPANPSPAEFPSVPFACDVRPFNCGGCSISCPHGDRFARVRFEAVR